MFHDPAIRIDPDLPQPLQLALGQALSEAPERVRRVSAGGRAVWLKQAEQLSLRWRIQKGDTRRAFEADRMALHDLNQLGLPVPDVVAEGPDFFATSEAGTPISALIRTAPEGVDLEAVLFAAGQALGRLHSAGVVHGRPKVRDICWDGQAARLIDFERYRKDRSSKLLMAQDMMVLLHSVFTLRPAGGDLAGAALRGWQSVTGPELSQALLARARGLGWLQALAGLGLKLRPRSKELGALPLTLGWITKTLA